MITLCDMLKIMDFEGTTLDLSVMTGQYACRDVHSMNITDYYNRKVLKVYFESKTINKYGHNWIEFHVHIMIEGPWVDGTI